MPNKKVTFLTSGLIIIIIVLGITFIFRSTWNPNLCDQEYLPTQELVEGRNLANAYCSRCHEKPSPELLPKNTWLFETLPAMGPMLGIRNHNGVSYDTTKTPNQPEHIFSSQQMLSNDEWQKILDYYEFVAPEHLPSAKYEPEIITDSLYFRALTPDYPHQTAPVVTIAKLDPGNRQIYVADANKNAFMVFDDSLKMQYEYSLDSPISDIHFFGDRYQKGIRNFLITYIGYMNPSDLPLGSVARGSYNPATGEADLSTEVYRDSLTRPVSSQLADLNKDKKNELIMNEFGNFTGRLSWIDNPEDFKSKKNVLIEVPGCLEAHVLDLTGDNRNDVVALCAQTSQAIYLFKNKGNGKFERESLLKFRLTAGSSSFELHDFNDDGYVDILYTSGDNADFSQIFKPYHGVYIYLNDGKNKFTQAWFYPINGAYKAVANDFNKNGKLDIAVIAYFPNHMFRPEENFILFQNEGDLTFTPYHHPAANTGRWIRIDVADWTGNGYDDILLSNFSVGPLISDSPFRVNWTQGPYFLLLENHFNEVDSR